MNPYIIERVETLKGKVIYEAHPKRVCDYSDKTTERNSNCAQRTITAETAYLMNSALQEVIRSGTGRAALELKREISLAKRYQ